jgi:hypothetical protein
MPTHLYCLIPRGSELAPPASVRVVAVGDVLAWVGDTDAATLSRDARDVARQAVAHDRIAGAALAQGTTPLPASLADAYENDDALSRDLRDHAEAVAGAFDRVRDKVEMTVIIAASDPVPAADAEGRGRAYLEAVRSQPGRLSEMGDRVAAELRPLAGTPQRRPGAGTLALSHLISRTEIDRYRVQALSLAVPGCRMVIDGPRAPYSFARFSPRHGILDAAAASAA